MPVAVRVPTRIRVDPAALGERRDLVEEALAAAAGRALRKAAAVLAEDAPGAATRLNPPEVTWYGDGLAEVPEERRAEVEAAVAAVLWGAATDAGVATPATDRGGGAAPGDEIAEPFDPIRFSADTGRYTIPSYEGGGDPVTVPIESEEVEVEQDAPALRLQWSVVADISYDELEDLLYEELAKRNRQAGNEPQLGVIFEALDQSKEAVVWGFPEGNILVHGPVTNPMQVGLDENGNLEQQVVDLPASWTYRLRWYAKGDRPLEVARKFFGPGLRDEAMRTPGALKTLKLDELVEKRVRQLAKAMAGNECFLELRTDDQSFLLVKPPSGRTIPEDLDAELVPLTEIGPAQGAGTGAGGAGGEKAATAVAPEVPGFVSEGAEGAEAEAERAFPQWEGGIPVTLECDPYEGEPSLQELGKDGEQLRGLIEQIAYQLQIPHCDYPGRFLLNAALAMGSRAWAVGLWEVPESADTRSVAPGTGNFGAIDLNPAPSAQVELLRHLAGITPLIRAAANQLDDALTARPDLIKGIWQGRAPSWTGRFWIDLGDGMREAVGVMFLLTCRVVFLQLLNASRKAIEDRLANLDAYASHFEAVVVPYLLQVDELTKLRDTLRQAPAQDELARINRAMAGAYLRGVPAQPGAGAEEAAAPPEAASWPQATQAVVDALAPPAPPTGAAPAPRILRDGGRYRIRDRAGRVWDLDGLERAIMLTRGTAESFEPLVKQLVELDEVVERFRDPDVGVKAELKRVLDKMWLSNWQIASEAKGSTAYAFRAGRISKDLYQATVPYTRFALSGIHLQAHLQIGEFFRGDGYYGAGLDDLLGIELGRRQILAFVEFAALTLLAVLCPPLAVVAGIGTALYHYGEALEKERIYQALIDPELVITRVEVEAELFAAQLGLALSFLPVVPKVVGAARAAFRVAGGGAARAAAGGVRGSLTRAAAGLADDAVRHLVNTLEEGLVLAVGKELAEDWAADQVLSLTLTPMLRALEEEWGTTGPIGGLDRAMNAVLERAERRRRAKAAAATGGGP